VGRRQCWWARREGGPRGEKERREVGGALLLGRRGAGLRPRKERREGEKRGVWRVLFFFLFNFSIFF
jgi:hypothetical protein